MVAVAAAVKGAKRRGKRGKEAKRSAKVKERAMEAESAPEENDQFVLQHQQKASASTAPYMAPLDPATTCTPAPSPAPLSIFGTPIPAFHLELGTLGGFASE